MPPGADHVWNEEEELKDQGEEAELGQILQQQRQGEERELQASTKWSVECCLRQTVSSEQEAAALWHQCATDSIM